MKQKSYKPKKCKNCEETFIPVRQFQGVCSFECAVKYAKIKGDKQKSSKIRGEVKKLNENDKSYLTKKAQQIFNKYIRLRDKDLPCISCGHTGNRQRHAGHFMPVGSNGHIRFDEANCHSQCSICNNHKSGNLSEYEPNLVLKIGQDEVDRLKRKFTKTYSVEELKQIIETYKHKVNTILD